ncbi:hypothetical protein BDN72DRAFT_898751 [Pluteus cervinus]|uniref:Uncharacterized protein n=1 Tax=Pluteus cervinus TaxID=181527 RepID=A0ACD3APS0_9AGAR|nr:hypothetical protein BDN72DRAFT_898751 [Pluteus cervinus]
MSSNTNPPPHARPRILLTKQTLSVAPGQAQVPYPSPSLTSRSLPQTDLENPRSSIASQTSAYLSHRNSALSYVSRHPQSPAGRSPNMYTRRNDDASSQRSLSPSEPPYRTRRLPTPPSPQPRVPQATRIIHGVDAATGYQTSVRGQHLDPDESLTHRGLSLPAVKEQEASSDKKSNSAFASREMYDYQSRPMYTQTAQSYDPYQESLYHSHVASGAESALFQDGGRASSPAPAYVAAPPHPSTMPYASTSSPNNHYPYPSPHVSPQSAYPSPPQSHPRTTATPDIVVSTNHLPFSVPQQPTPLDSNRPESSTSRTISPQGHSTPRPTPSLALSTVSLNSDDSRTSPTAQKFVYPGGRSVAKPKVRTSSTGSRSLFGFRSKKKKEGTPVMSPPPAPPPELSHPEDFTHIERSAVSDTTSPRSTSSSLSPVNSEQGFKLLHRPNILGSESSTSSHARRASTPFVYPSSRSTARPHLKPKTSKSDVGPRSRTPSPEATPLPLNPHLRKISDPSGINFVEYEERSKIMGITVKKKKRLFPVPPSPDTLPRPFIVPPIPEGVESPSERQENFPLSPLSEQVTEADTSGVFVEDAAYVPKYLNTYPLSSYDKTLLTQDELTSALLRRLNGTGSPSFHDYGNDPPPADVLDLGCGQGHWVLHAARTWRGYDTRVVGYDLVDVTKSLLPEEYRYALPENVSFKKGNFLKDKLPFDDESFDLVRMANLSLCIPAEKWEIVLEEVYRVLKFAGRLELVDDHVFFPLAKALAPEDMSDPGPSYPQLDVEIPSSPFPSSFSRENNVSVVDLYGAQRDEEDNGEPSSSAIRRSRISMLSGLSSLRTDPPSTTPPPLGDSSHPWIQQASACQDLEAAFEDMLLFRFGINIHPSTFLLEMLRNTFNHSRKVATLHLTLAPSERSGTPSETEGADRDGKDGGNRGTRDGDRASSSHPVSSESNRGRLGGNFSRPSKTGEPSSSVQAPGLMLWPSTFIPMASQEIEVHALHNPRVLLSCRERLIEFLREESGGEVDSIQEVLWDYERFLSKRLSMPANVVALIPPVGASSHSEESLQSSAPSTLSSGTWDAVKEYQTDIREHLGWSDSPEPGEPPATPSTPRAEALPLPDQTVIPPVTRPTPRASVNTMAPPYSRTELVHVRTFHVFEATKLNNDMIAPDPNPMYI